MSKDGGLNGCAHAPKENFVPGSASRVCRIDLLPQLHQLTGVQCDENLYTKLLIIFMLSYFSPFIGLAAVNMYDKICLSRRLSLTLTHIVRTLGWRHDERQ